MSYQIGDAKITKITERELGSNFSKRHLLQQSLPRDICRTYHLAKRSVPMGLHLTHFYAAL